MPTLSCRNCGTSIRVQGVAALCPQCGFLVQIGEGAAPGKLVKAANKSAKKAAEPGDPLLDLIGAPAPVDESMPDWLVEKNDRARQKRSFVIWGSVAAVAVALVVMVIVGTRPNAPAPVAVAPPKPVVRPPAPVVVAPPPPTVVTTAPASQPAPLVVVAAPPRPHAALKRLVPRPLPDANPVSDERIGESIRRGIDFLYGRFDKGTLLQNVSEPETEQGVQTLCVYALLHAGQATGDPRLLIQDAGVRSMLSALKSFPMTGTKSIYSRSLRLSALGVYDRDEDRTTMEADAAYLLKASMNGAYGYSQPPPGTKRGGAPWDNSNSQYGALGLWAAAEAGIPVPGTYWNEVESHWLECQGPDGGWSYRSPSTPTTAMTAAGLTMLFVARSQSAPDAPMAERAQSTLTIQKGLNWLGRGNTIRDLGPSWPGYTLYGIERVGLASGYKYFGEHDWYLTLAADAIKRQQKDGSWSGGTSGDYVETAFTLLFLSRGRHPVFMAKLQYDGKWNNRPRDVAHLTDFADRQLERRLNWQVVDLERPWLDWTDSPVLFISGDKTIDLNDEHLEKLRNYVRAGGLIFTHADRSQADFNAFIEGLVPKLWPGQSLKPLPEDHPVYSVFAPQQAGKNPPALRGVDNGARLLLVHSPTDFARLWQRRSTPTNRTPMEMGVNVVIYASGKRDFANRAGSPYVAKPQGAPAGAIPVARIRYEGSWDPEPGAWERFSRWFQSQTSIAIETKSVDAANLAFETAPFAHLTGVGPVALDESSINALRFYLEDGGTLLIDACGGSKAFRDSLTADVLPKLLAGGSLLPMSDESPLLAGNIPGTDLLVPTRVRGLVSETFGRDPPRLRMLAVGKGAVVVSDLDITSGLLGTNTWSILGYAPTYAQSLMKNVLLWTIADAR